MRSRTTGSLLRSFFLLLVLPIANIAAGEPLKDDSLDECGYLNVFVDNSVIDRPEKAWGGPELVRRKFLKLALEVLPELDLRVVQERSEARWTIGASAFIGPTGVYNVSVRFRKEIALTHDIYLALLNGNDFPFSGAVRGEYTWVMRPEKNPGDLKREVEKGVKWIWGDNSELVSALCDSQRELRVEGWDGVRELRLELVEEMKRVRRERADQKKRLRLEVEEAEQP